jgi:hypothetical protein
MIFGRSPAGLGVAVEPGVQIGARVAPESGVQISPRVEARPVCPDAVVTLGPYRFM